MLEYTVTVRSGNRIISTRTLEFGDSYREFTFLVSYFRDAPNTTVQWLNDKGGIVGLFNSEEI